MTLATLQTDSARRTLHAFLADSRVYWSLAVLIALLVSIGLSSTLRREVPWGGDEALYVLHARNLAEGRPYVDTGYIFNPRNAIHPAASPPGLPLLLSVVYRLRGLDWADFKILGIDLFCLFLLVFAAFAKEWLPRGLALIAVVLMGLHPFVGQLKDTLPSEFPFMFFCYGALLLFDRCPLAEPGRAARFLAGAALLAACACLTRPIGMVLFPAMALASLYRERRWLAKGLIPVAVGLALTLLVQRLFRPDIGTYVNYFDAFNAHTISRNIDAYGIAYRYFLEDHAYFMRSAGHLLAFLLSAMVIVGFVQRAWAQLTVFELFTLGYIALLLIYPISEEPDRYSFPLWPLVLLYAFVGCNLMGSVLAPSLRYAPVAVLCAVLVANFIHTDRTAHPTTHASIALSGFSRDLFRAVRAESPEDAVLIARKPTVLTLFTGRRAGIWPANCTDAEFLAYAHSIGAGYLVQEVAPPQSGKAESQPLDDFITRNPSRVKIVFANPAFRFLKLTDTT